VAEVGAGLVEVVVVEAAVVVVGDLEAVEEDLDYLVEMVEVEMRFLLLLLWLLLLLDIGLVNWLVLTVAVVPQVVVQVRQFVIPIGHIDACYVVHHAHFYP